MNEDFVTYELAKKLREKGFVENCLAYYTNNDILHFNYSHKAGAKYSDCYLSHNLMPRNSVSGKFVDAPTISQVLKWLRKKKIVISILPTGYNKETGLPGYYYVIYDVAEYFWKKYEYSQSFETWEECAIDSIKYVLDNLI